ncbi:MAG: ribbon-helix-helix protein, CopG family [Deltaproteobacteria bacterium]|nr:ribbon-helix-helix protein, CopG family [Deltaproteobacteria bacterium]
MKSSVQKKSSFTLPAAEVSRVNRLRRKLGLRSNTDVVRRALTDLENSMDRNQLRKQFQEASSLTRQVNREDYQELDGLAGEGLK